MYCRQKNETKEDITETSTKKETDNEAFESEEKEPCESYFIVKISALINKILKKLYTSLQQIFKVKTQLYLIAK